MNKEELIKEAKREVEKHWSLDKRSTVKTRPNTLDIIPDYSKAKEYAKLSLQSRIDLLIEIQVAFLREEGGASLGVHNKVTHLKNLLKAVEEL